jgi:phospholipase C
MPATVPHTHLSRRAFLTGSVGAATALLGGGWPPLSSRAAAALAGGANPSAATPVRSPGSLPYPALAAGTDTMPGIEHIVVLMMENHSYDNLLGMLGRGPGQTPRGDGFTIGRDGRPTATNPYPDGSIQKAFRMPTTCQLPGQPSQEWAASHNAYNNGRMDGFVRTPISPAGTEIVGGVAMGYWTEEDLPFTHSLASTFPIADRWFCSVLAQTDPNRRYLIAGTSAGMTDDIGTSPGNAEQDSLLGVPAPNGTIFNQLDKYGISWTDYVYSFPTGATPELFLANDAKTEQTNHRAFSQFFTDLAGGSLSSFVLLDQNYSTQSQENPQNMVEGEALMAQVVRAIGSSPLWSKTLLVINYDEHGGYYDHVPPPVAIAPDDIPPVVEPTESAYDGFARYGIRVPAVVISPYAKRDYVSHVIYDHTSILAMVERKWNLPALTYRDANASDLTDFLDLPALAAGRPTFPTLPALSDPGNTAAALACSKSGPGQIPPPDSVIAAPRSSSPGSAPGSGPGSGAGAGPASTLAATGNDQLPWALTGGALIGLAGWIRRQVVGPARPPQGPTLKE